MKLRNEFYAEKNVAKKDILHERIFLGLIEYELAVRARLCGDDESVAGFISKFYEVTGCDPNCDCCDDFGPAPVVSVATGPAGPAGPAGATGAAGATGPAGATGGAGAAGVSVLANQYPRLATLGTAFESLLEGRVPFVLTANKLSVNLDAINIHTVLSTSAWSSPTQLVRVMFNGNALNFPIGFYSSNIVYITIDVRLSRITNTTAKYELKVSYSTGTQGNISTVAKEFVYPVISIAGLDFTANPYNIDVQGDSAVIGDITCEVFEVVYKHKS